MTTAALTATAGLECTIVYTYPGVPLYIVEVLSHPGGRTLALLDAREEDLEVMRTPEHEVR